MALITGAAEAQQSTKSLFHTKMGFIFATTPYEAKCRSKFKQADSLINVGALFNRTLNSKLSITYVGTETTVNTRV